MDPNWNERRLQRTSKQNTHTQTIQAHETVHLPVKQEKCQRAQKTEEINDIEDNHIVVEEGEVSECCNRT